MNASNSATINEKTDGEKGNLDSSKELGKSTEELELGKEEMLTYRQPPWYGPLTLDKP